jgi:tRNA(His) 5'-end guanylyltransferase
VCAGGEAVKFDELDTRMRIFETAHDHCVIPGIHMVVRLDGRGFTRLTREVYPFEAPYDGRFRDYTVATVEHLMNCGFKVIYDYTQSDEISLLLHRDDNTFGRKLRKIHSVLSGEASAKFSLLLGGLATFDCRVSQLPSADDVVDYFRWRQEDANRNALNGHCYWTLRADGESVQKATETLVRMSVADKNELLFQHGVNFNDLPNWHKRGVGLYWELVDKPGVNPLTGESVVSKRWRIRTDYDLPRKDEYDDFMRRLIRRANS